MKYSKDRWEKNERGKCSILMSERSDVRITSRNGGEAQLRATLGRSDRESDRSGKVGEKLGWSAGRVTQERRRRGEGNRSSSPPSTDASIPPGSWKKARLESAMQKRDTHTHAHTHANASLRSHPLTLPSSYNLKAETGHSLSLSQSASSDFFVCRTVEVEHSGRGVMVGGGEEFPDFQTHFLSAFLPVPLFNF